MSTRKPDNFMQLFWLVLLYVLDTFLYVPGIRMNTLLDLFQVTFWIFPYFIFHSIAGQKFKIKEIFIQI